MTRGFRFAQTLVLLMAAALTPAHAAAAEPAKREKDAARAGGAAGLAAAVEPFVDEQTLLVVRVDLAALDPRAVEPWVLEAIRATNPPEQDQRQVRAGVRQAVDAMAGYVHRLREAGARELYLLASMSDFTSGSQPGGQPGAPVGPGGAVGPALVVPVTDGADADAIASLLEAGPSAPPPGLAGGGQPPAGRDPQWKAERIGGAVVAGHVNTVQHLRNRESPPRRPELAAALAAARPGGGGDAGAGDATDAAVAVRAALVPPADLRKVLEETLPELPPPLGGGPVTAVTRGMEWASAAVRLPPRASLDVVVQCRDEASARALADVINRVLESANAAGGPAARLAGALKPAADGDRLTLALTQRQVDEVLRPPLAAAVGGARRRAMQARSANNMKQLLLACHLYADQHKGEFPPDLEAAAKASGIDPAFNVLKNPRRPNRKVGYVYVRPAHISRAVPDTVVLYEAFDEGGWDDGINVGYGDGHVEFIADEAAFRRQLEVARARSREVDGGKGDSR